MMKLCLSVSLYLFIFTLSCHFSADAQDSSVSLLYCDSDIHNFSLASGIDSIMMSNIRNPEVIDYHLEKKVFFWSAEGRTINKAPLWQEGARPSVLIPGVSSYGLAVDWIHNLIYFTDIWNKAIHLARLDGTMVRTILKEESICPYTVALNPAEGFMFWYDYGKKYKIERCNMDGTSRKVIVKEDIGLVYSMAIDLGSRRIFWVDKEKNHLSSAKFDGNYRKNLITQLKMPASIDIYGQHVYFVTYHYQHKAVYKASKVDGSGLTKLFEGESTLRSLKILDPSKQSQGYNVCGDNNGGCSHLCLPTSGRTFSCACPNDRNMSSDNFTCLNSDGSAMTTPSLTTNATTSQLPLTVSQTYFTSSTGSPVTTPSLTTSAPTSQYPFTVSPTNSTSSTEENKNSNATVGSSGTHGILAVVMASLTLIAMVGMMIYFRQFLMKTVANLGSTNPVQKKSCEENMYMEAPV